MWEHRETLDSLRTENPGLLVNAAVINGIPLESEATCAYNKPFIPLTPVFKMPVDPVIHSHMTYLVQREKKELQAAEALEDDIALWKKRVGLARERGEDELAEQARERALALIAERRELQTRLDMIANEKDILRRESRRPHGRELEYAEELLRRWQESGLVDPDKAALDEEFDKLDSEQALAELHEEIAGTLDDDSLANEVVLSDPDALDAPESEELK